MRHSRLLASLLSIVLVAGVVTFADGQAAPAPAAQGLSAATRAQAMTAVNKAAAFLHAKQKADGSWESHPGVTGLVAAALLRRPGVSREAELRTTGRALDMLAKLAKPDGGIHADDLETYVTAIAVMALQAGGRTADLPAIRKAREYLVTQLLDEGEGLSPSDPFYGGIGYRPPATKDAARSDIINLEYGLRALKETDLGPDDAAWKKAIAFLQRLQNRDASNDQAWAANDGGFIYQPGLSKAGEGTMSYGSATYSGVLGYTYANLKKGDPRVDAAYEWIKAHYTVDENPGMGQKTVYYYYMVLAKALAAVGDPVIVDAKGQSHNWREELAKKLIALQHPEGFWVNPVTDEMQGNPVLVTAFTLTALQYVLQ
jgi:squalene-hopene/tetraprenyl-beta-curcumene cyclase